MNTEIFLQSLKRHDGQLFGRDQEVQQLHDVFRTVVETKSPRAVFVHGYSGSGKSQLIHHALRDKMPAVPKKGYFVDGKYDQQRSSRPYSALTDACRALCLAVHKDTRDNTKEEREQVVALLETSLVKDVQLLATMIPELETLVPKLFQQTKDVEASVPGTFQFDRLKTAIRTLFACVSKFIPIALSIDDLQWADSASIDILESLLDPKDGGTPMEMVIFLGAYRDNELVGSHPMFEPIQKLERLACSSKLHVNDLSLDGLNVFVASLLKYEDYQDVTIPLSKSIHQRTRGNIFFVLQFLQMLVTSEILHYSFVSMKWEWDGEKLFEQTSATENVTDLVIGRMRRLPPDKALALIVASQLGNRFDAYVVSWILDKWKEQEPLDNAWSGSEMSLDPETDDDLKQLSFLDIPIEEGFVLRMENVGNGNWFRFLHDRIQQAAEGLISDEAEKKALRLRLGTLLLDVNKKSQKTWAVLSTVDLLNMAMDLITCQKRKLELVEANVQAAKIAASQSAFFAAGEYLSTCRSLLDVEELWAFHYDLALEIYTMSAEMSFCCGNSKACLEMYQEVQMHRREPKDSWLASYIAMKALGAEAKYDESIEICFQVLNETGFRIPMGGATPDDVGAAYGKVKEELTRRTNQEILSLHEEEEDEVSVLTWKIFSSTALIVWHANRPLDHTFICCHMTLKTLERGLSEFSGQSFALQAISCIVNNDFDLTKRLQSLWSHPDIVRRFTGKEVEAGTMAAANAASGHLFWPLSRVAEGFMKGYESGMKTGALEWAMTDAGCYLLTQYMSGMPLTLFETECWVFIKEMKSFGNRIHRPMCEMYLQCALNLMGKATGPVTVLKGEATKEYRMARVMAGASPDEFPVQVAWFAQLMLSYYFEDFETAAEMAMKHEDFGALEWPLVWSVPHPYFRGLAYVAKIRLLKKAKSNSGVMMMCCGYFAKQKEIAVFFNRAKAQLAMLQSYAENGMINAAHMYKILQAEVASITPGTKYEDVFKLYKEGVRGAARCGFRQDAGLASERLAVYMMGQDSTTAAYYAQSAIDHFEKWGAQAKADAMRLKYLDLSLKVDADCHHRSAMSEFSSSSRRFRPSGAARSKEFKVVITGAMCE